MFIKSIVHLGLEHKDMLKCSLRSRANITLSTWELLPVSIGDTNLHSGILTRSPTTHTCRQNICLLLLAKWVAGAGRVCVCGSSLLFGFHNLLKWFSNATWNCLSRYAGKPDFIIINWLYICTSVIQYLRLCFVSPLLPKHWLHYTCIRLLSANGKSAGVYRICLSWPKDVHSRRTQSGRPQDKSNGNDR